VIENYFEQQLGTEVAANHQSLFYIEIEQSGLEESMSVKRIPADRVGDIDYSLYDLDRTKVSGTIPKFYLK